jgi:hypothetical protein
MKIQLKRKRESGNMMLPIKELEIAINEETEDLYYFNDKMLNDGVFIKYNTLDHEEIGDGEHIESYLEVGCLNDDGTKAGYYILYWDSLLSGIQLYRMIKDVYEIYVFSACKEDFILSMEELSCSYRDSTMQGRLDLIPQLKREIELVRHLAD